MPNNQFYFFTEPAKLQPHTQAKAFGAVNDNQFRLHNLFSSTSAAKVFAITGGNVLVQQVAGAGNTGRVNLVIKPNEQPDLDFPKIDYIIYKGLKKSSLVNGTDVAVTGTNDLTTNIWTSFNQQVAELPNPPASPLADEVLGLKYSATETGSYKALDGDSLNIAFFSNVNTLFPVKAGEHIGEFETTDFGVMIIFEKIGFEPTFKLSRELNSELTFTALPGGATQAETFRRKHDKEAALNFVDSAAFFGAFFNKGLQVYNGTTFDPKTGNDLYTEVIAKHFNKNKIYLDIRNEYGDSFNYYENYENNIQLALDNTQVLSPVDYYQASWPLLSLDDADFDIANTDKNINFALPIGDNDEPIVYLKRGYTKNLDVTVLPKGKEKYLGFEVENERLLVNSLRASKNTGDNKVSANYYHLKYIRRFATPDSEYKGLSIKKESFLDNLFPLFDMKTPFISEGSINMKVFYDSAYIDKTNINEIDFTANLGVAIDNQTVNFIAYPNIYNQLEASNKASLPLSGKQSFSGDSFIDDFNKLLNNYSIENRKYVTADDEKEYLSFAIPGEDDLIISNENTDVLLNQASSGLEYDFENTNIISLTKIEYDQLALIKDTEFTAPYKVYLGIANTKYLTIDEDAEATTVFALRGIKENTTTGKMETHEHITSIEVFAEDDLYNWAANTETGKVIDAYWVDQNGNGSTQMPYERDKILFFVKTEDAIGKKLTIQYMYSKSFAIDPAYNTSTLTITANEMTINLPCSPAFFHPGEGGDNVKEFYLKLKVGDGKFKEFSSADGARLRIHAVRFVPGVMTSLGWPNAFNTQDTWFTNPANINTNTVAPQLNFVTMAWALGFARAQTEYNTIVNTNWNTPNGIASLEAEIKKMVLDGAVSWPTSGNPPVPFGSFSLAIVTHNGEKMPLIEKYYYTSLNHEIDTNPIGGLEPLDDMFGTLGSFNWHVAAKGIMEYENATMVKATIQKIGIYIKDSFDFDVNQSEYLGDWDFINNDIARNPILPTLTGYYSIGNEDYRNYRTEMGKGYNYHLYSEVGEVTVSHVFTFTK